MVPIKKVVAHKQFSTDYLMFNLLRNTILVKHPSLDEHECTVAATESNSMIGGREKFSSI